MFEKHFELGTVEHFDGRPEKRFGFIQADSDHATIFFHLNNYSDVRVAEDSGEPHWTPGSYRDGFEQKGARVLFARQADPKGPRAAKWGPAFLIEENYYWHGLRSLKRHALRMTKVGETVLITLLNHPDMHKWSLRGKFTERLDRLLADSRFFVPVDPEIRQKATGDDRFQTTFEFRKIGEQLGDESFDQLLIGSGIAHRVTLSDRVRRRWAEFYKDPLAPSEVLVAHYEHDFEEML